MFVGNKIYHFLFAIMLVVSIRTSAEIVLPKVIGSNMVLQRNKPVAIWGNAEVGEIITVSFDKQTKTTTTNALGKWMIYLDKMFSSVIPAKMIITGSNTITLENILVGEVWLCSGQSNMEYTMTKSAKYANAKKSNGLDSAALKNENSSNIRLFLVKRDLTKSDGAGVNKGWNIADGIALGAFSAAGYHFAKNIYDSLNVPVGIIAASVSGSNIDPWLDGSLNTESKIGYSIDTSKPGKFYNGLIHPLAPFTLKGFLWYQGETNCFLKETTEYTFKFKHLINSWRTAWNDSNASFYFVQIAPFNYSNSKDKPELNEQSLPQFREAQAAALDLPNTAMIITTDLVDKTEDIHPTYKWEIGRRLALLALANDYDRKLISSGPVYRSMNIVRDKIEIEFDNAPDELFNYDGRPLDWFEIAGSDGRFTPASAVIKGNKVIVSASKISKPKNVRFAWHEAAQPNLYNKAGLPAAPFRTGSPVSVTTKN